MTIVLACLDKAAIATALRTIVMGKDPKNHGRPWTNEAVSQLERLADQNTPTRVIALKLGRTEDAIYAKASDEDISLSPTNQRPYNRR